MMHDKKNWKEDVVLGSSLKDDTAIHIRDDPGPKQRSSSGFETVGLTEEKYNRSICMFGAGRRGLWLCCLAKHKEMNRRKEWCVQGENEVLFWKCRA